MFFCDSSLNSFPNSPTKIYIFIVLFFNFQPIMHKLDQRLALSRQKHLRPELFADKDITPLNPIFRSNNFTIQIRYLLSKNTTFLKERTKIYIRTNFKINTLSKVSSLKSCVKDNHSVRIGKNCAIINCGYIFLFSQSTSKVIKQSEEKLQPPFYSVSYLKSMHLHREKNRFNGIICALSSFTNIQRA